MRFLISDTFTKSIERLDARTRAAVKSVAFDVLSRSGDRGHRRHRLAHARDRRFWSVRVNRDLRIIVAHVDEDAVLCYAGHHDEAYAWAEQRKVGDVAVSSRAVVELADREPEPSTRSPRATAKEHVPPSGSIGSRLDRARGAGANESVAALHGESHIPPSEARARRLRMRNRAVAPLPVSSPAQATGTGGAPLVALLRLARVAPETSAAGAREATSRATSVATPEAPLRWVHGPTVASIATAIAAGLACVAPAHALRDAASLFAAGMAAATAVTALLAARQRASAARAAAVTVTMLRDEIRAGHLDARSDRARVDPELRPVLRAVDEAVEAFAQPFTTMTATLERIAAGELLPRLTTPFQGDLERHRSAIDGLADFMLLSPASIRRLIDTRRADDEP